MFYNSFYYFFHCVISKVPRLITAKICMMLVSVFNFVTLVQKFGVLSPKKFGGQKHAKFGLIPNPFPL